MKNKILVTGATGFVGKYLVKKLVKEKYKVRCLVRKISNIEYLKKLNLEIVYGDIINKDSIKNAIKDIDVIIHLASIINSKDPNIYNVNVRGSQNIIDICKKNKIKVIYISSTATKNKYLDKYGKTKLEAEKLFLNSNLKTIVLRPGMIYAKDSKGFLHLLKYIKMFPFFIPIIGNGKYNLNLTYIEDLTSTIIKILKKDIFNNKAYDLSSSKQVNFNKLIGVINKQLNIKKIKIHIPILICKIIAILTSKIMEHPPITLENIKSTVYGSKTDISNATKDLNYKPINLEEGLKLSL